MNSNGHVREFESAFGEELELVVFKVSDLYGDEDSGFALGPQYVWE